jgi:hypothetical protein
MSAMLLLMFVEYLFTLYRLARIRRRRISVKLVGTLEVRIMAVSASTSQYLFLKDIAIQLASGTLEPLDVVDCHVEVEGPAIAVAVPDWAPDGTQFAFDVTARGTVYLSVTTAKEPTLEPLTFTVDVDDPAIAIVGMLYVADQP